MTTFWRDGHYRYSRNGDEHWVDGHWVDRDNWDRYGSEASSTEHSVSFLESARIKDSRTARFVNPNANCPVCGSPVFFYQNESGSRVFFDELGPPWWKHPCTDTAINSDAHEIEVVPGDREPSARNDEDIASIQDWITTASIDPEFLFEWRYGNKPWTSAKIAKRIKGAAGVFLILKNLESNPPRNQFMYCKALPKCVKGGSVVAIKRGALSFLDLATMTPREVQAREIRRASGFVNALASGDFTSQ